MKHVVQPASSTPELITRFCDLINQGIGLWVEAGQVLCQITASDPNAYAVILGRNPHLTRDVLDTFERIGRREIFPFLIVDPSPACRRLITLPYDEQVRLYGGRVHVVLRNSSGLETRLKRVSDLTASEADRVFDLNRVRTPEEQGKLLRAPVPIRDRFPRTPMPTSTEVDRDRPADETGVLEEGVKPVDILRTILSQAQDTLLRARVALNEVKRGSKLDTHIGNALSEIGRIRYAINEGEL